MLKWNIPEQNEKPVRLNKRLLWLIVAICFAALSFSYFSWVSLFTLLALYQQTFSLWGL